MVSHHRAVLIAFVQGVIGAFNEDLSPLDKRSREKPGNCAQDYFVEESRMHGVFYSTDGASNHQNPHSLVFMIQKPRSRFVTACVMTQESKLRVR